jgi:hypothetical protein
MQTNTGKILGQHNSMQAYEGLQNNLQHQMRDFDTPMKPNNFEERENEINVAITNYSEKQLRGGIKSGKF